jgi:hypothetical protein
MFEKNTYSTKEMKVETTKSAPSKDGEIWKEGSVWKFKWKGSECGYATKKDAEKGLKKINGASKKEA